MKPFVHQQVVAIKECGHVLCGDCFKKFVGSSKQCYVCQKPVLKKKDFIALESGGTGFSSHNKVDVKVFRPTENSPVCSRNQTKVNTVETSNHGNNIVFEFSFRVLGDILCDFVSREQYERPASTTE
jgi:singapore isolate B (sub-type 7) whole genome shotgun sequence assembly, scaffold_0